MSLKTKLYARRAAIWCSSLSSVFASASGGVASLCNSVYTAYFKGAARRESHLLPGQAQSRETWIKMLNRWMAKLGFRRRRVVRRRRNAQHLQSLESELELLKAQLQKVMTEAQPTPAPASSSGWPTSMQPAESQVSGTTPSQLPACPTKKARPPPPPRRTAFSAMPTKLRLRPVTAPREEEAAV